MTKHTPTPWKYDGFGKGLDKEEYGWFIKLKKGKEKRQISVEGFTGKEADANAAFIVKAVNAHEYMEMALKEARHLIIELGIKNGATIQKIDTALAKAKGEA